jgi:hypothetical protein
MKKNNTGNICKPMNAEIDTLNLSDVRTVEIHALQFLKAIWRNIKRYFMGRE